MTRGYRVLADKRHVIKAAKAAETAMTTVGQLDGGHVAEVQGRTRITSTDTLTQIVLPRIVADLQSRVNGLFIEVINTNAHLDLAEHQINVTIRPSMALPSDLEGDCVAQLGLSAYAAQMVPDGWIGLSGPLARSLGGRRMAETLCTDQIAAASDSFFTIRELAAAG